MNKRMRRLFYFMNEAGDGTQGGAGGGSGTGEGAAGGQGDGGAGSVLAGAAGTTTAINELIPEKYRVSKEDGTFDIEASARKLAEGHTNLEKKLGSGDAAPSAPTEYKINVPDEFKEAVASDAPEMQQFLADAHAVGMTQKQLDFVMNQYAGILPQLASGNNFTPEAATESLKETWKTEEEFNAGVKGAYRAAVGFGEKVGVSFDDMESSGLTNNPVFMRIMAAVSKEMGEDKIPNDGAGGGSGDSSIEALQASEAYRNPKHADHAKVSEQVRQFYAKKYGDAPVL